MCGIIGFNQEKKEITAELARLIHRGQDGKGSYHSPIFSAAHCLHAIVGHKPQPIETDDFVFGANCEIYNWKELKEEFQVEGKNDAEVLANIFQKELQEKPTEEILNNLLKKFDGVFAFFLHHKKEQYTILARDLIGVKPLWFNIEGKEFSFASEQHLLSEHAEELNPRKILFYKHKENKHQFFNQEFFTLDNKKANINKLAEQLEKALIKRIPDKPLGVLFSGGLDSTLLAFLLKKAGKEFTAYYTTVEENKESEEVKKLAKELDINLKVITVTESDIENTLPKVIEYIGTADPVKVEVGLVMHQALEAAKKDKIKVIFSGVGADDIFAGYKRIRVAEEINQDSLSSLRRLYERDLYRDDVLSMRAQIELRLPYLDKTLVQSCLSIDSKEKESKTPKEFMWKVAETLGLTKELNVQRRNAAQYSSGISHLLKKICKKKGFSYKAQYYAEFLKNKKPKVAALLSTGKDSIYALHIQKRLNYDIAALVTIESKNKDSFMFHTPTISLAKQQAEAMNIPLVTQETKGEKEEELTDLKQALKKAKEEHYIQGVVSGAIFSNYQRTRIEKICDELNLKVYAPLWHMDQETEMKNLLNEGFKVIMTKVAAEGLDASWLGKILTLEDVEKLVKLKEKLGINVAGEGGEFETLVLDAPLFSKSFEVTKSQIKKEGEGAATLYIQELKEL